MSAPSRPALRWFGGKWNLAPWIIRHFPPHRVYVEPFGGAASVLLNKSRSDVEVFNDLDDELVNLFAVLRDPATAAALVRQVELTPFARAEWQDAYAPTGEPIERARRLLIRAWMGHGSCAARADRTTGWRFDSVEGKTRVAVEWAAMPEALSRVAQRFIGVSIERRPAGELMAHRDHAETLFYVDPPYVHATRSTKRTRGEPSHGYAHELTDDDHRALLAQLVGLKGMVVLSGYASPLYDGALARWRRIEQSTRADGGAARVEVIWLNPAADAALPKTLFGCVA
jgi:DNA adenine methylase